MNPSRTNGNGKKRMSFASNSSTAHFETDTVVDMSPDFSLSNYNTSSNGNMSPSTSIPIPPFATSSHPISLPKSHIHRTPSELELEALTRRAEHEDVRMYSRLVCGMHDQIQHRYFASGGYVHPLSRKSIQGIVKTKRASDQELATPTNSGTTDSIYASDNDEWGVSYDAESMDDEHENTHMSSWSSQLSSSQGSMSSVWSLDQDTTRKCSQEEECVFDMEL